MENRRLLQTHDWVKLQPSGEIFYLINHPFSAMKMLAVKQPKDSNETTIVLTTDMHGNIHDNAVVEYFVHYDRDRTEAENEWNKVNISVQRAILEMAKSQKITAIKALRAVTTLSIGQARYAIENFKPGVIP